MIDIILSTITDAKAWIVILIMGIVFETLLQIKVNWEYAIGEFSKNEIYSKEKDIRSEIKEYSTRALTMAGLTFAAIALIISGFKDEISIVNDILLLFFLGFALFILSFELRLFSGKRRIIWEIQQRLVNYGFLSIIIGLALFFGKLIQNILYMIVPLLSLIILLHISGYYSDYKLYKSKFASTGRAKGSGGGN